MSEIQGHPPEIDKPGSIEMFPYHIITDYGNQLMTIQLNGLWSGSLDDPSTIILSVEQNTTTVTSEITFCFKLAAPGATATATLSCNGTSYPITLSVPTVSA